MGGSSSKEKRTKPQTTSIYIKKAKVKGKSGKVKGRKSSVQWSRTHGEGGELTFVPCRRKSSGDTGDLNPPPQRARARSLRFGDFTQLGRVHKVGDTDMLPVDIAFFQDGKVEPEELCHVCSVYTGSETLVCGVCYRVFHQSCLAKIGQWSGPAEPHDTGDMWSCHQCANLGNLLTEEEIIEVLKRLDKCGIRREDDLTLQDYLAYCHMSLQEDEDKVLTRAKADNASRRFAQVDTAGKGRITWCQFLNIETVRILKKRNKNALVRLLTTPEVERARDAFRKLDTDMDGRITKATAHEALDRNSRRSGYYPDETMMYIDEDLEQSISWMEFLRDRAIFIIAERPCIRAPPLDHSTLRRRGSNRSSLAVAISLPATPLAAQTPTPQHAKGVATRHVVSATAMSVPTTPTCKQQPGPYGNGAFRHSDGVAQGFKSAFGPSGGGYQGGNEASGGSLAVGSGSGSGSVQSSAQACVTNRSAPTTPVKKQCGGFPLLPPPPPSSRHGHRGTGGSSPSSVPSTPVRKCASDFLQYTGQSGSASYLGHAHHEVSHHRGSAHSDGSAGLRLSGGHDFLAGGASGGRRLSGQGHSRSASAEQQGSPASGNPFRPENSASHTRRSSHGDSATGNPAAPTPTTPTPTPTTSNGNHVTGKPPMGTYGRAIAAPPYGKLVERVQKGEYRQTQARSLLLTSDSSFSQATPTFGHVTGDSSTGRRPLSLV